MAHIGQGVCYYKKTMRFIGLFVCWSVTMITGKKLLGRFPWNTVEGCSIGQERILEQIWVTGLKYKLSFTYRVGFGSCPFKCPFSFNAIWRWKPWDALGIEAAAHQCISDLASMNSQVWKYWSWGPNSQNPLKNWLLAIKLPCLTRNHS